MKRKKTSIIWTTKKDIVVEIVTKSNSFSEILKFFGLKNKGGNYQTLKYRLQEDCIDYSHIKLGIKSNIGRKFNKQLTSLKEILKPDSTYPRNCLKKRLINENLLEYKCSECGLEKLWNNKKLSLQLDHINGISDDNRLENLRFLCPNCHSQTDNYAGKAKRTKK